MSNLEKGWMSIVGSVDSEPLEVTITRGYIDTIKVCEVQIRNRHLPYAMTATLSMEAMEWLGITLDSPQEPPK
jgi:hypothetical protein